MTKKLFWEDPYMKECEAVVKSVNGKEVVLDQTCAFAFSGGQASDSATINGIEIIEAKEGKDIIYVLVEAPKFKEGDLVKVKIDWDKRFKLMKLHSVAHIVWFLFEEETELKDLIGSNVSPEKARLDFTMEESVGPLLLKLEEKTNKIIEKGLDIAVTQENGKQTWKSGKWSCDCSGTHLKNTKEIGKIKLKRKNIGKGKERIEVTISED